MLSQNEPFGGLDYLLNRMASRPASDGSAAMPMDAYRRGEDVWVHFDLPGVSAESIDIDVERNVLTVTAERAWENQEGDQLYSNERRQGTFRRQVNLGEALDTENIEAAYDSGVLTLRVPVAEVAKPRKIAVTTKSSSPIDVDTGAETEGSET